MRPAVWIEEHARPLSIPHLSALTLARGALLIVLGFLIRIEILQLRTPNVAPAATEFSAERALTHLEAIGAKSEAVGELNLYDYQLAEEGTLQFGYTNTPADGIELTLTVR